MKYVKITWEIVEHYNKAIHAIFWYENFLCRTNEFVTDIIAWHDEMKSMLIHGGCKLEEFLPAVVRECNRQIQQEIADPEPGQRTPGEKRRSLEKSLSQLSHPQFKTYLIAKLGMM